MHLEVDGVAAVCYVQIDIAVYMMVFVKINNM